MEVEIWKPIPEWEGLYEASNLGNVRSVDRIVGGQWGANTHPAKGRILKPKTTVHGYYGVNLYKGGKRKCITVHRLIALAFLSNPENKPCINHKDGNRKNNHISNLEWVTYSENTRHAFDVLGQQPPNCNVNGNSQGEKVNTCKITEDQVREIRALKGSVSGPKVADMYGLYFSTVYKIWNRECWKHVKEGELTNV